LYSDIHLLSNGINPKLNMDTYLLHIIAVPMNKTN